ncbi:MAG TPA: SigE family RNA polymerase sigma factor [Jatrophihabitans sp.]|nr:SigE family RNA polymerase sigma factor [Jatrophihabitans sp.]
MADAPDFDGFYLASRDRLVLQLAALTGDPVEALDHVQEAFVQAWLHWDRVGRYGDPQAWVRRVAYNRAVSRWRRARRAILSSDAGTDRIQLDPEQHEVIAALGRLPPRQREAIVLHHLAGYPVEEVAEQMSISAGTVKSMLSRGRTRLAELLTEWAASNE